MVDPLYEKDGIRIFQHDCGLVLPLLTDPVDCIVSDPPYHLRRYLCALEQGEEAHTPANDAAWMTRLMQWYLIWLPMCQRLVWDGPAWWFVGWEWAPSLIRACTICQWPIQDLWTLPMNEALVLTGKRGLTDAEHDIVATALRSHGSPNIKPVALLDTLLSVSGLAPGATVLDPFMGCGSTLVAAKRRGLKGIGMEYRDASCATAIQDLERTA